MHALVRVFDIFIFSNCYRFSPKSLLIYTYRRVKLFRLPIGIKKNSSGYFEIFVRYLSMYIYTGKPQNSTGLTGKINIL